MILKSILAEYSETEFLQLVTDICEANSASEQEHSKLVRHFVAVSGHPAGTDLIYYPEDGADDSPQGIVNAIKAWRTANSLPGFKHP